MTQPWVKVPVTLVDELGLDRLDAGVERTFWRLFFAARHLPVKAGYLLSGDLAPLSLPEIARAPRSTTYRHVNELRHHQLLGADLAGRIFVPAVIDIARRFPRRSEPRDTSPSTPTGDVFPQLFDAPATRAVENPVHTSREGPDSVPPMGLRVPPVGHPFLVGSSEASEVERGDVFNDPVQNPAEDTFSVGPRFDLVPSSIPADSQVAYFLARLAQRREVWQAALGRGRDQRALEHLWADSPRELSAALAMEHQSPRAQNPLAWLTSTIRDLCEREVSA